MHQDYELCKEALRCLIQSPLARDQDRNEATTRLHLINTLFISCLGWDKESMQLEESHEGRYADYVFGAPSRLLIVEAKREGYYYDLPIGYDRIEYKLKTLTDDNKGLKDAVHQVADYCHSRGVQYAAVANGHQLVLFIATRTDGIAFIDGRALVFSSLDHMYQNFLTLWNSLSSEALSANLAASRLLGTQLPPPGKLSEQLSPYPGSKRRNIFQIDLQTMSDLVLEDIPNTEENETEFLQECYYTSGSLSKYALVSKQILTARYASLVPSSSKTPITVPAVTKDGVSTELLADALSRRPILLIGDVGVGKTMFLRRLLKVDAVDTLKTAVALYIDLGSQATLTDDLATFIIGEIDQQLYTVFNIDINDDGFVRGVYAGELARFSRSVEGALREIDPPAYERRELDYLLHLIRDRERHIKRAIDHIVKARKLQVVLFIDNADQRSDATQQQAFLVAQELAQHTKATVFVSLRPETFYRSQRKGTLSGYHPKAFTISPPRIDRVLEKRLRFGLRITSGEIPVPTLDSIGIEAKSLDAIIRIFLSSIQRTDDSLIEFIENISGGNVRQALDIVRVFFGSGHVDTEKIIRLDQEDGPYYIPLHEFMRAIMYGDNEYYDPSRSMIANLFDVETSDSREHFLLPITLTFLMAATNPDLDEGFIEFATLSSYAQSLGYLPSQLQGVIKRAARHRLIDVPGRLSTDFEGAPECLRVNASGAYHTKRLCRFFTYLDAIVVDTPILDSDIRAQIHDHKTIRPRLDRAEIFIGYLDAQWESAFGSATEHFDWPAVSADAKRDIADIRPKLAPESE